MKITILEQNGNTLLFILSGVSAPFANAIRRIIMAEVPSMAIEDVMMFENTSVMFDEIVAHRLGLIPLKTDLESYLLPEECKCKSEFGCDNCRASFTLDVEAKEESKMVYSGDLVSENDDIYPVTKKIPIVKLAPGQRLKLEAYAKLGKGLEHAKWQPVSACTYKFMPIVKIDTEKCNGCGDCVKYCPKNVFSMMKSKPIVKNEINCTLCMECISHCPVDPPPIKISHDNKTFIFYIESTGSMSASNLVKEAAKILKSKAQSIIEQYKNAK
jgi:DNA-directed RNA polymerase subunit D